MISLRDDDQNMVLDDELKADLMNSYFAQVGKNLSNALNTVFDKGDVSYISRVTPKCCELELNDQELDKQMSALKPYKAMGHDEIRSQDLKIAGDSVKPGIRYILQKSPNDKEFPDKWKIAKLKTTFKKGEACSRENYRPLSILSIPSKFLEGHHMEISYIVCFKVDKHMEISGIGHTNQ